MRVSIHPTDGPRNKERRGGTAPFGRQSGQLVDFSRLTRRLVLASGTEPEFSGDEPHLAACGADLSISGNGKWLRRVRPALTTQTRSTSTIEIKPIVGKIFKIAPEREVRVIFRFRHQIARPLDAVGIIERRLIDVSRLNAWSIIL